MVDRLKKGEENAESFDNASLYFSSVVDFKLITKTCNAIQV